MARSELIKELEIRKREIITQIEIKFPKLMEELQAIDKILSTKYSQSESSGMVNGAVVRKNKGTPKGDMTWLDYVQFMLVEIGGKAKASEVAKIIANANSNVSLDQAKNMSSNKLSKLASMTKIKATKGPKKEGYLYEIF